VENWQHWSISRLTAGNGAHATAIDPLLFARECDPSTATMHSVSEPHLAIVVRGKKQVLLNEEAYRCRRRSVSGRFSGFAAVDVVEAPRSAPT